MSNLIPVHHFNDPALDLYARTTENQLLNRHEPEKGIFIAESPKVISRALDAGCIPLSFLCEDREAEGKGEAAQLLQAHPDVPAYIAAFDVLTQLTGFQLTRGMLCAMRRPRQPSLHEICRDASRIAILEHVMNPTNVGAIFRSAAALNFDAVLLTSDCSNPLYRRAIRVSMGTVFQIPWCFLESAWPEEGMQTLHSLGFKTAAMALRDDTVCIDDPELLAEEKLAVILGSEGDGLEPTTIEACDYTIRIPMAHGVDSLNVAAASAIAFWQLGKH